MVAYWVALSPKITKVHNVFYVSILKKYVSNHTQLLSQELIEVHEDLTYEEKPIQINDK